MSRRINLNADLAEGWGAYDIGDDAALMSVVQSASVACGFHAGDHNTMHRICMLAKELGVSRQTINAIEKGKFDPSLPLAFRLAKLFNSTIEDIFLNE